MVSSRSVRAAYGTMPLVCDRRDLVAAVDRSRPSTRPIADSAWTGPIRPTIASDVERQLGLLAGQPGAGRDGEQIGAQGIECARPARPATTTRCRPPRPSRRSRSRCPGPTGRPAVGRVRSPTAPTLTHVAAATAGPAATGFTAHAAAPPASDPAVPHPDLAGERGGDVPVVRDDHDRGAGARADRAAVASPRRPRRSPVPRSARRPAAAAAHPPPPGRRRPAVAHRRTARAARGPSGAPRPTRSSAAAARLRRWPTPQPRVQQPVRHVVHRPYAGRRGGTAGRRSRSGSPATRTDPSRTAAATSYPSIRTVPEVGRSSVPSTLSMVDLPEPDGPTIATSSPRSIRSETPPSAATPPGYTFVTSVSSITSAPPR